MQTPPLSPPTFCPHDHATIWPQIHHGSGPPYDGDFMCNARGKSDI